NDKTPKDDLNPPRRPFNPLSQTETDQSPVMNSEFEETGTSSQSTSPSVTSEKPESFQSLVNTIYKSDELKPGTIVKNRYRVTQNGVIGSGSFGVIYEVEYLETNTKYALKIIPPRYKRHARSEESFLRQFTA